MPTLDELLGQRIAANQESSDYVGLHRVLNDLMGGAVRIGTAPLRAVVGDEPVYGTLGWLGTILGAPARGLFGAGEAAAEGEDLEGILRRAGQAIANQRPASAGRFLKELGFEDPTGVSSFLLESAVDVATAGGLAKAIRPAARAAEKVPRVGPRIEARRLRRETEQIAGQKLRGRFGALESERMERALVGPLERGLREQAGALRRTAAEKRLEAGRLGREITGRSAMAGLFGKDDPAVLALETARSEALALSRRAQAEARALLDQRIARVLDAEVRLGSRDALQKFLLGEVEEGAGKITKAVTVGEVRRGARVPEVFSFDARAERFWARVPADDDFAHGVRINLSSRRIEDPRGLSWFAGRFLPVKTTMAKLGLLNPLLLAQTAFEKEFSGIIKTARSKAKELGIVRGSESSRRIAMHLDGQIEASALTPNELAFSTFWKDVVDHVADRAGLPMEKRRGDYFPHMRERGELFTKGFRGEFYGDEVPRFVFDAYFQKRTGAMADYPLDALEALEAYGRVGLKKAHFDPVLKEVAPFIGKLPDRLRSDAMGVVDALLGRPHVLDRKIVDTVRSVFGAAPDASRLARWATAATIGAYRGLIGLNVGTMLAQLTQSVNVAAEMGFGRTLRAMAQMAGIRKGPLTRSQAAEHISTAFKDWRRGVGTRRFAGAVEKLDDVLFKPAEFGDNFSRGAAVLAGVDEALSRGFDLDFAIRNGVRVERETQFLMGALGGTPLSQSAGGRLAFQFARYPLQQITFLTSQMREGRYGDFLRYVLAVGFTTKLAANAGLDLSQIETPTTLPQAARYLTLNAQPTIRLFRSLVSGATVDFSDPDQARRWSDRVRAAGAAFVPVLPRARLLPGAAEVADLLDVDRRLGIPLRDVRGRLTRTLSPVQYGAQALGVRTTQEAVRREAISRMLEDRQHFLDQRRDLLDQALSKLASGRDATGELLGLASLTGDPLAKIARELKGAAEQRVKPKVDRIFEMLPNALKIRHAQGLRQAADSTYPAALAGTAP